MKRLLWLWAPLLGYLGFIFYFSSLVPSQIPQTPFPDKWLHVAEYFVLPFLFFRVLIRSQVLTLRNNYLVWGILFSCIYAIFDELHQRFIPGRNPSMGDFLADGIGILVGAFSLRKLAFKV